MEKSSNPGAKAEETFAPRLLTRCHSRRFPMGPDRDYNLMFVLAFLLTYKVKSKPNLNYLGCMPVRRLCYGSRRTRTR